MATRLTASTKIANQADTITGSSLTNSWEIDEANQEKQLPYDNYMNENAKSIGRQPVSSQACTSRMQRLFFVSLK